MKLPVRCGVCLKVWAVPRRDWPYDWNYETCACGADAYVFGTPADIRAFQRSGDLRPLQRRSEQMPRA